ncbi:MAG: hypothetical protein ACKOCM_11045 [Cyanobacteriota bacterium]
MSERPFTVLEQLDQLEDVFLDGSGIPFTGARLVNKQEAEDALDAIREALPPQIAQADALLREKEQQLELARQQASQIIQQANQQREQLLAASSIRQDAERQAAEIREKSRQQQEQATQDLQIRLNQLDQQFAARRQQLEQEAQEMKRQLAEKHERTRQQNLADLEAIRAEGQRLQQVSQKEAERIQAEALQFKQQTQLQCDGLINRSRQEAATVQEGANHYAEQVLSELETRLQQLSQVVLAGRRELGRLQPVPQAETDAGERREGPSRGRRLGRIRPVA